MDESNEVPIGQIGPSALDSVSVLTNPSPTSNFRTPERSQQHFAVATTTAATETIEESSNCSTNDRTTPHASTSDDNNGIQPSLPNVASPSAFQSNLPLTPEMHASVRLTESQYENLQDEGYDSDGLPPPFDPDEVELLEEVALGTVPAVQGVAAINGEAADTTEALFVDISAVDLAKMSTNDLKSELKKRGVRGLSNKNKAALLSMLQQSLQRKDPIVNNDNQPRNNNNNRRATK
jgi:hypothetical protein